MQREQFTFYNGAVALQFVLMRVKTDILKTNIVQTCTCNEYPLFRFFYIVKMELTGVHLFCYF